MKKKAIISTLAALVLTSFTLVAAEETNKQGWIKENGFWYFYQNQQPVTKQWQGNYYLKKDGRMASNEWIYDIDYQSWYYLKSDGSYASAIWQGSYYLKTNGKMAISEWIYDNYYQSWYYLKSNGVYARSEWQGDYYLKSNGKMAANEWVEDVTVNGWYYLKGDGSYARSEWQGSYYLKTNGKMAIDEWIFDKNYDAWYYLKSDGSYAHDEQKDGRYLESDGKMRETADEKAKRQFGNAVQTQEKKWLEQAIQWMESEDAIVINDAYTRYLMEYGSSNRGKTQENIARLISISQELQKENQKEVGSISNTLLEKYNLQTMPEEVKQSLSLYAASLINSVRRQMKLPSVKVTDSMITIAEKIAKEYINDGRFVSDGKGHDAHAINKVVAEYGLITSQDNSKENGFQYYENATSVDFQDKDYFTIRKELRNTILRFLLNNHEFDHAQSVAGVNFGKSYRDEYFGVGLGASGHFIFVDDTCIVNSGSIPFKTIEISQKVRTDYEQKVIQRLKEHLAILQ